jgi:hypothetical protein
MKLKIFRKNCAQCGEEFEVSYLEKAGKGSAHALQRRYCSDACKKASRRRGDIGNRLEFKCEICGSAFYRPPSQSLAVHHTCSNVCRIALLKKQGEATHEYRNCVVCQKSFEVQNDLQKYCSPACTAQGFRKGKNIPCIACGKEFYVKPKRFKTAKCCSRKCQYVALSQGLIKNVTNGRSGYRVDLGDDYFKSSLEADYARWCKHIGKQYVYEHKTFSTRANGIDRMYTPDFFHPETDAYVELKGMPPRSDSAFSQLQNANSAAREYLVEQGIDIKVIYMRDFYHVLKEDGLYDVIPNLEHRSYKDTKSLVRNQHEN